ncbi:MAG: autotransporter-associated beta strand repeat-containing protein, partial [Verrucomicrobiaceae bacterium]|nr:autotransporter-associated beta strand repeat-containing protein [Verrucomicrobiaceae bacterium]
GGTLQSSTGDIIVHEYSAADLTISSLIRNATGVTKTGTGALVLSSANNTFTGAVTITEGTVRVTGGGAIGDFAPVTLKNIAGSGLQLLANETVGNITGGGVLGGSINIGANTLTTNTSANITYSGLISGSGTLVKQGTANFNLDTVSHTGFNGNIVINQGLVFLSGNGVVNMPAVSSITSNQGGAFLIDFNSGTTLSSRVNDVAAMNLSSFGNGAFFGLHIRSSQAANHSETVGAINLQGGAVGVGLVQSSGTQTLTLTGSQLNRTNNATLVLDGNNLGSTASVGRTRMFITAAPAIVGGTGVAGGTATNVSIVPYAVSTTNAATAVAVTDIPNTFVNYNATTGMTPLLIASEYKLDSAGYTASADPTDNLRFTAGVTGLVTKTFNAAVFDSSAAAMSVSGAGGGGNVLTVGSGAMLFTSTAAANATTLDGFDSITPGTGSSNEWIITAATTAAPTTPTGIINSVLTDGVGATTLTKSGTGILVLGAANLYSGPTVFNQGAIRASNLSNLGTGTALNFFGGTLQFGGVFDPSTRAITFNAVGGGGTFDTNGNDISIANPIGNSGGGSFTKTGAGNLTINAAATHTGGTTVANGTLTAGVANMLPATSSLTVNGATATLDVGAFAQTVGTFTLAAGTVTGAGPITSTDIQLQAGTQNASNVLAGGTVVKTTTGVVTLAGANTFTGQIFATNGEISFNSIADANGTASALGAPANALQGAIQLGLGTNTPILTYTGSGHTSNRTIELVGTTGTSTINANGAGALSIGAVTSEEYGAKSLVLSGTSASGIVNKISAPITECFGVVTLQKLGSNTWQLDAASTYTGATQIDEGVLRVGIDNALPVATAVRLGNGTTAGTFDLNGFNQTIGSLTSSTNSTTATNIINVPTGKTLTINGAVTLGANVDVSTTLVNATGGGSIVVNSAGANFQVGGATGGTNENTATVDFSGLSTFTANLGAGTFRIGDANTSSGTAAPATMKLAPTSTITAAAIRVGDSSGFANNHTLTLGTGVNTLNADTVNIGSAGTGIRSSGTINFAAGDTTGSVKIRASDGSSAATLNMVNTSGSTTGNIDGTMDFTGHTADLKFTAVTMAARSVATGAATATLSFDQGFFDAVTLNIASRTGAGTGNATGTVNLGDSVAPGSPITSIGTVNMAVNTSGGGTVVADMNITGGTVNLGPVNMANAAASRTATATLDITGGTTTLAGNITRTGGAGTETATVTVDGGTLDMAANSIGTGSANVSLVAASGTLKNLGELNGGGAFSKTTAGTLTLEGVNTYTGDTTVSAGTLVVNNSSGSGTGSGAVTVNASTTLAGNGSIAPALGKSITLNGTTVVGTPGSTSAEDFAMTVTGAANIALNGTIKFDIFANANTGTLNPTLTSNDLLTISAADWINAQFGGSSVLKVETTLPTTAWAQGDAWKIFDWSGLSGTAPTVGSGGFATLDLPILTGGQAWNTTQLYTTGVISIDAIPEPGRAMLLIVGLLGVGFRRRRK